MRSLSVAELLTVWERGWAAPPLERALTLLSATEPELSRAALARVTLGRRDARLLQLRERMFGPHLQLVVSCPRCTHVLEMTMTTSSLLTSSPALSTDEGREPAIDVSVAAYEVRCRPPNTEDLLACVGLGLADCHTRLFELCAVEARHQGRVINLRQLPEHVGRRVIDGIAASDPQADIQFHFNCPDCYHRWNEVFDIVSFFWSEIDAWARRMLADVHALASAYGWREADILAMSPGRRQIYLNMAAA
jgi:hypothetical protein